MQRARGLYTGIFLGAAISCADPATSMPDPDDQTPSGPPQVTITMPQDGATVQGRVPLRADASNSATVSYFVDGTPVGIAPAAPFEILWDSVAFHENPLPAPGHSFDIGYYFTDGRYGDFEAEVRGYTNLYYAWAWRNYPTDMPWGAPFSESLRRAAVAGRRVHLNLQDPMYFDEALDRAQPVWEQVSRVELADEPPWDRAETERQLTAVRQKLALRGLAERPLGIVYTRDQVLNEDALFASGLDWVGIEAYVDPPGSETSKDNVDSLVNYVNTAKARVPQDKKLVLIMMAYDRNGGWKNLQTLIDLQQPTYELAANDARVLAITMFSYGRPGGTHDHPELKLAHRRMGERILSQAVGALSNGPHKIEAVAIGKDGTTATSAISITVENP
jgi:hypothetical protein